MSQSDLTPNLNLDLNLNLDKPRPRGRPRKDAINEQYKKITTQSTDKPKRKYTRRKPIEYNVDEDGEVIKTEGKKRGQKRGRKKKGLNMLFKPEEVLDYIDRNFPLIKIDRIREKVIDGMKAMREFGEFPYILYKFTHESAIHYYDDKGAVLNADGRLVGYFIKQPDGHNKLYMFEQKNKDNRSYQDVINQIEKPINTQSHKK